ncbi:MAG: YigZ family protein [Oscillospiraceae bacterium]|nr:YigZ family protein [Oscillospiraceae bacterium]
MTEYLQPFGFGEAEFTEKRSRFIGRVWPVESESEATAHIEAMRRQHYDATHNVYAYIVRENGVMRYSDDGEPQGTSGQPTLNVFRQENIVNVCCVVTRYFGGTLLGAGGLVRAYSAAAKAALDAAGVCRMAEWLSLSVPCSYSLYERVRRLAERHGAVIEDTSFAADVVLELMVRADCAEAFARDLTELTSGAITPTARGTAFRGVRIR